MSYTKRNLLPIEVVLYKASLHWVIFMPGFIWLLLGFVFEIVGLAWIPVIVAICSFVSALLRKLGSEFMLTNKRVILRYGIISRRTVEILLPRCEGVSINQGIIGRILNYGTLVITTGGATLHYNYVKSPVTFRNKVNEAIDAYYSNTR